MCGEGLFSQMGLCGWAGLGPITFLFDFLRLTNVNTGSLNINTVSPSDTTAPLEATHADFFGDETEVDISNISTTYLVLSTPNTRIHKDHSLDHVIGDVHSSVQTRRMTKTTSEQGFISVVYEGKTHKDLHTCLFACFLSQEEPKKDMEYDTSVFDTTTAVDSSQAAVREAEGTKRAIEEELGHQSSKKQNSYELSQEELQQLMIIVPKEGINIKALQTKYLIIDWEVFIKDSRKDDLVKLWSLVQERFNSTELTEDKEREIGVELKRLFEPDADDELWKS
nr:hypothetical protein [Tanacetum cinerariifolium]